MVSLLFLIFIIFSFFYPHKAPNSDPILCPSVLGEKWGLGELAIPRNCHVAESMLNPLSFLREILGIGFSIRHHMEKIFLSLWHTFLRYFSLVTTPPCKKAAWHMASTQTLETDRFRFKWWLHHITQGNSPLLSASPTYLQILTKIRNNSVTVVVWRAVAVYQTL